MTGTRLKLLAGTALTLAGVAAGNGALADTRIGWYVAVEAGQTPGSTQTLQVTDVTLQGSSSSASTPPLGSEASLKIDRGAAGFARAGYRFTPNLRAEAEFGTRPGAITDGLAGVNAPKMGKVDKASAMVNLIYDIKPEWALHPFVGIGAGVVQAKTTFTGPSTNNGHTLTYSVSSEQTVPAAQALAGASLRVTDRLNFEMIYRYLKTGKASYDVAVTDTYKPSPGSDAITDHYTAKAEGDFSDHSLTVGLRWSFGAPARSRAPQFSQTSAPVTAAPVQTAAPSQAPVSVTTAAAPVSAPAAPVAPPMPAALPPATPVQAETEANPPVMAIPDTKTYNVYFPFDSARINAAAQQVIAAAAQYAKSAPAPKVAVVGHTDTSGSAAYNVLLSKHRANAVASGLKAEGIPASAISVTWKGENDLAVPTRNGVANAENRRTSIEVSF